MAVAQQACIVNVASVPQRSLFRYPGGKTWLVPLIRRWLHSLHPQPEELIEPFAGGGIVGLTAAFEGLAKHVTLVELDADVASVWQSVLGDDALALVRMIMDFRCTPEAVREALATPPTTPVGRAFLTLLRNRVQYGGIIAPGASLVCKGENGHGVASRWYPATLRKRIIGITEIKHRVGFDPGDGCKALCAAADRINVAYFIDPPYTVAGRRLYTHSDIDHHALFEVVSRLKGDFLMTYDAADEVRRLADAHEFDIVEVPMKTTKHVKTNELLIGRSLDWARDVSST